MLRLSQVILFTPDVARLRAFYERQVGLEPLVGDPHWVQYRTAGAALALHPAGPGARRHIQLAFECDDLEGQAAALRAHGLAFVDEIKAAEWGRIVHLRDPEGNTLSLIEPDRPTPVEEGPLLAPAIVATRRMGATKSFYRDLLGAGPVAEDDHAVEFASGATALVLRPAGDASGGEEPETPGVSFGFALLDLLDWIEGAGARGLRLAASPSDRGSGLVAEVLDPDGNRIVLREQREAPALEELLAEPFEDDGTPRRAAIRKPVKKGAVATSRVAVRPRYRTARPAARSSRTAARGDVVAARGSGQAGARRKPKRLRDTKRARAKPAIGRLRKAERRTLTSQKRAVARASKGKPVKRAVARASRRRPARGAPRGGRGR